MAADNFLALRLERDEPLCDAETIFAMINSIANTNVVRN